MVPTPSPPPSVSSIARVRQMLDTDGGGEGVGTIQGGLNFVQHWWGDRKSLEDQAEQALIGKFSSGQPDYAAVTAKLEAIERYPPLFRQAFPGETQPLTSANIAKAIS